MLSHQRDRLSRLYHAALERAPEERTAFLKQACDGDDALRQEVESLLQYESASSRFLDPPAAGLAGALADTLRGTTLIDRQLGPYTILAPLGAGGMGEVYRARDNKLGRDVAIKILPSHLTDDPERRSRFAREARLLATLNHPNIGAIYGLEESDGLTAIVLELVEGQTLADRLAHGPMKIPDALTIAHQIADALEAAHEKGIVHRDLKPANIALHATSDLSASDQRVKVLDFGLAKLTSTGGAPDPNQAPSVSFDGTADGRIIGTPAYMSPEQARGLAVDKRTDIWAFGCVLFEMLSGRRPFDGGTVTDTLARVLERDPDWSALPAATPPTIRTLLERCLRKDPGKRLHDIADARLELEDGIKSISVNGSAGERHSRKPSGRRLHLGWIVAAGLAIALGWMMLRDDRDLPAASTEAVEFPILPPEGWRFTRPEFALSPDGRNVAFVATSTLRSSLWVRSLAAVQPRELPGTEGARNPFWSPDSQSIGFFANNQLATVQTRGGKPVGVWTADTTSSLLPRATWNRDDVIVFGPLGDGNLYQINAKRPGTPVPVTKRAATSSAHRWPLFLPDDQHFLYLDFTEGNVFKAELRMGSLATADTATFGVFDSPVAHAAGSLFFIRDGNVMVQSFDENARTLKGDPRALGVEVRRDAPLSQRISLSVTGRVVFVPEASRQSQLTWLDRSGRPIGTVGETGAFGNLDLSPDGRRVAVNKVIRRPGAETELDIWLMDVSTGATTRLTDDPQGEYDPAWSPDGRQIVFNSPRPGNSRLFTRPSDGSGKDVPLLALNDDNVAVASWSRGQVIVFNVFGKDNAGDLWTLSLSGDRTPKVFLNSRYTERNGTFSPDDSWIAYQSNETGRDEVYVRPYPARDPVQPISRDGGLYPRWRGDGRELFFVAPDGTMMAARIDPKTGSSLGVQPLFLTSIAIPAGNNRPYAVTAAGDRFLLSIAPDAQLNVITDWRALLSR